MFLRGTLLGLAIESTMQNMLSSTNGWQIKSKVCPTRPKPYDRSSAVVVVALRLTLESQIPRRLSTLLRWRHLCNEFLKNLINCRCTEIKRHTVYVSICTDWLSITSCSGEFSYRCNALEIMVATLYDICSLINACQNG